MSLDNSTHNMKESDTSDIPLPPSHVTDIPIPTISTVATVSSDEVEVNEFVKKGSIFLYFGLCVFVVLSVCLVLADEFASRSVFENVLSLYIIDNVFNTIAAFFLIKALWILTSRKWQKAWIVIWSLPVLAFVIMSTITFADFLFNFLGYNDDDFQSISFLLLLPLQIVVFIQFVIMTGVLYISRKKKQLYKPPPINLIISFALFVVLAAAAFGLFFYVWDVLGSGGW